MANSYISLVFLYSRNVPGRQNSHAFLLHPLAFLIH